MSRKRSISPPFDSDAPPPKRILDVGFESLDPNSQFLLLEAITADPETTDEDLHDLLKRLKTAKLGLGSEVAPLFDRLLRDTVRFHPNLSAPCRPRGSARDLPRSEWCQWPVEFLLSALQEKPNESNRGGFARSSAFLHPLVIIQNLPRFWLALEGPTWDLAREDPTPDVSFIMGTWTNDEIESLSWTDRELKLRCPCVVLHFPKSTVQSSTDPLPDEWVVRLDTSSAAISVRDLVDAFNQFYNSPVDPAVDDFTPRRQAFRRAGVLPHPVFWEFWFSFWRDAEEVTHIRYVLTDAQQRDTSIAPLAIMGAWTELDAPGRFLLRHISALNFQKSRWGLEGLDNWDIRLQPLVLAQPTNPGSWPAPVVKGYALALHSSVTLNPDPRISADFVKVVDDQVDVRLVWLRLPDQLADRAHHLYFPSEEHHNATQLVRFFPDDQVNFRNLADTSVIWPDEWSQGAKDALLREAARGEGVPLYFAFAGNEDMDYIDEDVVAGGPISPPAISTIIASRPTVQKGRRVEWKVGAV